MFGSPSQSKMVAKLTSIRVNQSILGAVIPIVMGQNRLSMKLLWYGDFASHQVQQSGGKGFGGKSGQSYWYTAAILGALCQGPINGITNVFDNGAAFTLQSATEEYLIPEGGGTYAVENADNFVGNLGASLSLILEFIGEVMGLGPMSFSATTQQPMTLVSGVPGAGEYSVDPATGEYTFSGANAGVSVQITYNYSMYVLEVVQTDSVPNTSPFQITVQQAAYFDGDLGVVYYPAGIPLTKVSGSPAQGQYSCSGGSPGGSNNGVYTFNPADAMQGVCITYQYYNSSLYTTSKKQSTNGLTALTAELMTGSASQAPWSYLTSEHPEQALGYTQIACIASSEVDCGSSAAVPNYSYEIAGLSQFGAGVPDANPADCIMEMLTDYWGCVFPAEFIGDFSSARAFWAANNFFISPCIESQQAVAQHIDDWLKAGQAEIIFSEWLLKLIPRGDTPAIGYGLLFTPATNPAAYLSDDDFLVNPESPEDPVTVERKEWQDAYNRVTVEYSNRASGYNPEPVPEQDDGMIARFGLRDEGPQHWDFITTQAAAVFAANLRLKRYTNIWRTYKFKLGWCYAYLEPMDIVCLTDSDLGFADLPVRITEITDNSDGTLEVTAEDWQYGTSNPSINPKQITSGYIPVSKNAPPGACNAPIIFEAPVLLANAQHVLYIAVSGAGANWGGADIWLSSDGINYVQIGSVNQGATMGVLAQEFSTGPDPDLTDVLQVNLQQSNGVLNSVPQASADLGVPLCYVVPAAGIEGPPLGELLAYETAEMTGANLYSLSYLRRRLYDTNSQSLVAAGASFCVVDNKIFQYAVPPAALNSTFYIKLTSFNLFGTVNQSLSDVPAYVYTPQFYVPEEPEITEPLTGVPGGLEFSFYNSGDPEIAEYWVYRSVSNNFAYAEKIYTYPRSLIPGNITVHDYGMGPGAVYFYWVVSITVDGVMSDAAAAQSGPAAALGPPTYVTAQLVTLAGNAIVDSSGGDVQVLNVPEPYSTWELTTQAGLAIVSSLGYDIEVLQGGF